jgi:DNA primase catalytic core
MSSILNEWIKNELYPSLYEVIDRAFPEHDFKSYSGGWRSKTYLDGSPYKSRIDKTVITKNAPSRILEQGGDNESLIDYVIKRDRVEFIEAVKTLADIVGLQLPKGDFNEGAYKSYKEKADILEDCNSYFTYCLENSPEAKDVKEYLASRGYSDEDIKAMELGYIPAQEKLFTYLQTKGHSQSLIEEVVTIKHDTRIGSTHKLVIPYRSGGSVKGFKFRTVGDATPKYLNSQGLDKNGGFFNLLGIKGDKDVVIVEGELDSLSATVRGVENVVATGGSSISSEQIQDAIRKGAKSFTLCFDTEVGKEDKTNKDIEKAIEVILAESVNRVYIVTLPDINGGKTDPDSLIKEKGVEAFKQAITEAVTYWEYKLQNTLTKYGHIQEETGLQARDIDNLLEEVVETASQIPNPTDRDRYKSLFISLESIKELGISEESFSITVDRLTATRDKEAQDKELKRLLFEATQLQGKGDTAKALELLDKRIKEVKLQDKATEFSTLLSPLKEEELKNRIASKPESLDSGLLFEGEPLLLPSGAISIFTAPTSHGKTTLLLNLALNVAQRDKETYFFSYEEDSDSILISALNIYLNEDLSRNNRRSIESYFKTGSLEWISYDKQEAFSNGKEAFFNELIETRKINIYYNNYRLDKLIEAIRYLYKNAKPEAIFIDYMQLIYLAESRQKSYSRQEELKEICIALKDVAVETGLPIILGAQFNREVVNIDRMHPTKIGEAGDIERIANLIVGFWKGGMDVDGDKDSQAMTNKIAPVGTLFMKIHKNRKGRVGQGTSFVFNGNTGKIENGGSSSSFD